MRRLITIVLLLGWCLGVRSGSNFITANLPYTSAFENSLKLDMLSNQLRAKRVGNDFYIAAKLDKMNDIVYYFKKCMFNELFTFYRVGLVPNEMELPTIHPDQVPETVLNLTSSDNIGPFNIAGYGWCGGNHSYINGMARTAHNVGYQIFIDGSELRRDTLVLVNKIQIRVTNQIMNPAKPIEKDGIILLNELFCTETINYLVKGNSIQVSIDHLFENNDPVIVQMYYGMQSMFSGETHTLTANGKYTDWTPQYDISTFLKKDYPFFRRFIEKGPIAYQSSYLLNEGLGRHIEIEGEDVVFIGNSNGKTYHKMMANQQHEKGNHTYWSGVYTWFKSPVMDDADFLCYEGIINEANALFIDCKKAVNRQLLLPTKYTKKVFTIIDKNPSVMIDSEIVDSSGIKISADAPGSCVILFEPF